MLCISRFGTRYTRRIAVIRLCGASHAHRHTNMQMDRLQLHDAQSALVPADHATHTHTRNTQYENYRFCSCRFRWRYVTEQPNRHRPQLNGIDVNGSTHKQRTAYVLQFEINARERMNETIIYYYCYYRGPEQPHKCRNILNLSYFVSAVTAASACETNSSLITYEQKSKSFSKRIFVVVVAVFNSLTGWCVNHQQQQQQQ